MTQSTEEQWRKLKFHPAAELFPLMERAEFNDLVADIKANGLRQKIVLLDGMILDGRNRYRACLKADIPLGYWNFLDYENTGSYKGSHIDYVVSLNLYRRHLTDSQRAMVAARLADLKQGQKKADVQICTSVPEAAKKLHVSPRSVKTAKKVISEGTPELISAVDHGKVAVSAAAKQIEPAEEAKPQKEKKAAQPKELDLVGLSNLWHPISQKLIKHMQNWPWDQRAVLADYLRDFANIVDDARRETMR
jgi:hypothetical protein